MKLFGIKKLEHPRCRGRGARGLFGGLLLAGLVLVVFAASNTGCTARTQAKHFNDSAADAESKPARIVSELEIHPGAKIADLGAGGGYFTYRFARATGATGRVYAVDVNPDYLELINKGARERKLGNIKTIQARGDSSGLGDASVDLIFSRNVYHHLKNRSAYFRRLRKSLKPGGRIALIDYNRDSFWSFATIFGHSTTPEVMIKEMQAGGYRLAARKTFLKKQSFLVFTPTSDTGRK